MRLSRKTGLEGMWEHSTRLKWLYRIAFALVVLIFSIVMYFLLTMKK